MASLYKKSPKKSVFFRCEFSDFCVINVGRMIKFLAWISSLLGIAQPINRGIYSFEWHLCVSFSFGKSSTRWKTQSLNSLYNARAFIYTLKLNYCSWLVFSNGSNQSWFGTFLCEILFFFFWIHSLLCWMISLEFAYLEITHRHFEAPKFKGKPKFVFRSLHLYALMHIWAGLKERANCRGCHFKGDSNEVD